MNLLPFKAIFPDTKKNSFVLNQGKLYVNDTSLFTTNKKKYYQYLLEEYKENFFYKTFDESIYLLKKKNLNCSYIGIIGKININEIYSNKLVLHEEIIQDKKIIYEQDLAKFNILTSPLIIGHKYSMELSNYYNKIMQNTPNIEFRISNNKYSFWKVADHKLINTYFSKFDKLLVADGHHRISALKKNMQAHAFFLAENTLRSKNILRHYNVSVNVHDMKALIATLEHKYDIQPVINPIRNTKYIMLFYKGKITRLNSQNITLMRMFLRDIYNELSKDRINFENRPVAMPRIKLEKQTALYIPAMTYKDLIDDNFIFPPHSTYFEPKLHNGIISFSGCTKTELT